MSDPERLLDKGSDLEARLLASAVDEPPPPELLNRTLGLVAMAAPAVVVAGAAATVSAKSGGLLGAIAIGAALGLLVVGAFELVAVRAEPPRPAPVLAPRAAPSLLPSAVAPPIATVIATVAVPAAAPAPSAPPALTLAAELALLDEARGALRAGDRGGARALLDRYAREIPRGQLAREAALLRAKVDADPTIDPGPTNP